MTKFSIIIPTYQRVKLLNRAMTSVKNQDYFNYEVFVCSDGYSEHDRCCVLNMDDNRFIYNSIEKHNGENWGTIQKNKMILKCTGDYTIWLDDDNVIEEDYFSFSHDEICKTDYGMLIFKIKHNTVGVIPSKPSINISQIDTLNAMVKTDVAKKIKWGSSYTSDFYFIKEVEEYCLKNNLKVGFFDKIIGTHN